MPEIGQPDSTTIGAALPAGTNLLGKVGIDQTTPGTTNAVDVKTIAGVASQLDDTDKLAVSVYGKVTNAGDTALALQTGGLVKVAIYTSSADAIVGATAASDGVTANLGGLITVPKPLIFNGSLWDRQRSNEAITVLASAARTATVSSADFVNYNGKGLTLFINVSAASATPSVVFMIEVKDPISGFYWGMLATAAITGVGTSMLWLHPGLNLVPNQRENLPLARTWRVTATHADADSITYSVAAVVNAN